VRTDAQFGRADRLAQQVDRLLSYGYRVGSEQIAGEFFGMVDAPIGGDDISAGRRRRDGDGELFGQRFSP
jgi:hypothetical protein